MALSIHTNYTALLTQTTLNKTNTSLSTSQQRLSTGLRINSAADDAAGLQIATRLQAQTRGMGVAIRNISDSTSMLQTAEGAFNEVTDIVQRMKDLATQAANGTNSADDLTALNAEYKELNAEITNILGNTKYAGEALLTGGKLEGQVTFQIGSSEDETLELDLQTQMEAIDVTDNTTALGSGAAIDLTVAGAASTAIGVLETALNDIGTIRAALGANINRLAHTSNNLANMKDNTEMATGNIMDADFAKESANMTKKSMLMQSGISMLKQAGQMPNIVMSLLG